MKNIKDIMNFETICNTKTEIQILNMKKIINIIVKMK